MGIDSSEVRVGITGRLLAAPVGSVAPIDIVSAWAGAWIDLGYLSEDGPVMKPGRTTVDIKAWQSIDPVRVVITERMLEWTFHLLQRNAATMKLALGGGSIVTAAGVSTYTPPAPSDIDERAFGLEVTDGTVTDRYVLKRGIVAGLGDIPFKRGEATRFDVTVKALAPPDGGAPWHSLSNDPAWAEA